MCTQDVETPYGDEGLQPKSSCFVHHSNAFSHRTGKGGMAYWEIPCLLRGSWPSGGVKVILA